MPIQVMRSSGGRTRFELYAIVLSAILCCPAGVRAADDNPAPPMFSLHGFGTLGVVHSDANEADFVGNPFQPNGAGYSHAWSPGVDSKIGLQLSARFTDNLSAIVQVVSEHEYNDRWGPDIEWAHLKYQVTPDLSILVGRSVASPFLLSDTSLVGYTYPAIRPPPELYSELPVSNQDGIEFNYRLRGGVLAQTFSASYGQSTVELNDGGQVAARKFFQASDTAEIGLLTLRVGYTSLRATAEVPSLNRLFGAFAQFGAAASGAGFAATGAQADALAASYSLRAFSAFAFSMTTVGVSYDPGKWLLMSEWARTSSDGLLSNSTAWYVLGGRRFGNVMPYLSVGRIESGAHAEPGIDSTGLPPTLATTATLLNAGLSTGIKAFAPSQTSATIGVRWDVLKNIDLKLQYDRVRIDHDSNGLLRSVQPGFLPGPDLNAVSLAADFVF